MSGQWLDIYQKGHSVFNQHILNYKPNQQQTQRFKSEKKLLEQQITERFKESTPNKEYRFPKKPFQTEESHHSLISVVEYDLNNQNPSCCSFRRCLRLNNNGRNSSRNLMNRSVDNEGKRSVSRKIMALRKVKEIAKKTLSRSKSKSKSKGNKNKKRKVQVREIHLSSVNQQNTQSFLINSNKTSKKKLITNVRKKNQNLNFSKYKNLESIIIVNKPSDETLTGTRPLQLYTLQQQPNICQQKCKSPTNYSKERSKNLRYTTNRPAPNIRGLVVEKREIKILTSQQFNNRRSRDKSIKLPRDTFSSFKTLEQTKRSLFKQ